MSNNSRNSQAKVTITKDHPRAHKSPVIITSHLEDIPVISGASYIQDARNRWYIHSSEVKVLWDQHVNIYNKVKPVVVNAVDKIKSLSK
tara:strand:+ start:372 stop:638 length:267 start_codon:yes stop_codon:yes gene_type:complete